MERQGLVLAGIAITHPDRVISETGHVTKGELAEYHAAIAPFMLPCIARHPLSLLRCPSGIDRECFYQRSPGKGLGADVHPFQFRQKGKIYEYLYIEDEKGLLELIQMGAIEIHPWGAAIDAIDHPDRMIFDLDPAPEVPFEAVKLAAQDLRQRLRKKGLESVLKCTGGKGLHVTVPLAGEDIWSGVKFFAGSVAQEMVRAEPTAYVATMTKAKRAGKIFIDVLAQRLHGHRDRRLFGSRPTGRTCGGSTGLERTREYRVRQPVFDARRAESDEEEERAAGSPRTASSVNEKSRSPAPAGMRFSRSDRASAADLRAGRNTPAGPWAQERTSGQDRAP